MTMISASVSIASEKNDLLMRFQKDIFAEMIRSHGKQIETETVLQWCQYNDLADEIGLTENELKRAVYDSFVVAGTDNVKATEIARKMSNDSWDLYYSALFSDIQSYKEGLKKGFGYLYSASESYQDFCEKIENKVLKEARTITN